MHISAISPVTFPELGERTLRFPQIQLCCEGLLSFSIPLKLGQIHPVIWADCDSLGLQAALLDAWATKCRGGGQLPSAIEHPVAGDFKIGAAAHRLPHCPGGSGTACQEGDLPVGSHLSRRNPLYDLVHAGKKSLFHNQFLQKTGREFSPAPNCFILVSPSSVPPKRPGTPLCFCTPAGRILQWLWPPPRRPTTNR